MNSVKFSIIINTFERASTLSKTIESLKQIEFDSYEIIVVDGPSTDETSSVVQQFADCVNYYRIKERNLSISRNVGLTLSRGEFVAFIDDDSVAEPRWLFYLNQGFSDNLVGVVGGPIIDNTGVKFQSKVVCCDFMGDAKFFPCIGEANAFLRQHSNWFLTATGTNIAYRKKALLEINGFNSVFEYFLEETDVVLRLVESGYKVNYCENALVHHKFAPSHLRDDKRRPTDLRVPARSKAYFVLTHGRKVVGFEGCFSYLKQFELDQKKHLDWYFENHVINCIEFNRLFGSLRKGISEGIRLAFSTEPISQTTSDVNVESVDWSNYDSSRRVSSSHLDKKSLVLVSQQYFGSQIGGIGVWTRIVAEGFAEQGFTVSVITKTDCDNFIEYENGVWVHAVKTRNFSSQRSPKLGLIPMSISDRAYTVLDELLRIKLIRGVDAVSSPIWDLEGFAIRESNLFKDFLSLHTTYGLSFESHEHWKSDISYRVGHVIPVIEGEKRILKSCPRIIANSNAIILDLEKYHNISIRDKCDVVPHGLPKNLAVQSTNRLENLVVFIGRFEKRKGFHTFLEAIEILFKSGESFNVILMGGNSDNEMYQSFLKKNISASWLSKIKIMGFVSNDVKSEILSQATVFVAPSEYESFGLVFVEALKCGVPCVGTDVGGISEIIDSHSTGLLVPPGQSKAVASAISLILNDKMLQSKMSVKASKVFIDRFTSNQMISRLKGIFFDCVEEKQRGVSQ